MPMDMPLVVYSESLIETYLQAAKRLISSEGELKKELENFRRDPNISSETIMTCYSSFVYIHTSSALYPLYTLHLNMEGFMPGL